MEDVDVIVKQPDGTEVVVNTSLIDEDVLRVRCGLEMKETKWNAKTASG